jgi:hypothetical protein
MDFICDPWWYYGLGRALIAVVTFQPVHYCDGFLDPSPFILLFFMCSFSFSCCQFLVLDVIPLFNVDCHRLHKWRVLQRGFSLEKVNSPLSPDTSSRCQYVIVPYCHLSLLLIYLSLWARVVTVGKE